MRSRQARKIVRMVKYTPIDRMSSTWFDRALQWCATYRQPQIKKGSPLLLEWRSGRQG